MYAGPQIVQLPVQAVEGQRSADHSEFHTLIQQLFQPDPMPCEPKPMDAYESQSSEQLKGPATLDLDKLIDELYQNPPVNEVAMAPRHDDAASEVRVTSQFLNQSDFPKSWKVLPVPAQNPESPGSTQFSSSSGSVGMTPVTSDDEGRPVLQLNERVRYMNTVLDRYVKIVGANRANGKFQVHQVVHLLLLANVIPELEAEDLSGILVFCNKEGKPCKEKSDHFRAQNTKAMGLIWQQIKGNRNGNYDTFARAMRVGRERSKDYFDYLDSGKSSKKKVYKFGAKSLHEMRKWEELIPSICSAKS